MPAGEVCGPRFLQVSHRVWREGLLKMWDGDDGASGDDDVMGLLSDLPPYWHLQLMANVSYDNENNEDAYDICPP